MDGDFRRREAKDQSTDHPVVSSSSPDQQQELRLPHNIFTAGDFLAVEDFIGTVVDAVNDLTIEGFNSMEEYVVQEPDLKSDEDRLFLKQGVDSIYSKVQDKLDENLYRWESTCRDRYFNDCPPKPLDGSSSEKINRNGSQQCSRASAVDDGQEEILDSELISLRSQLVAAHREGAKMRRELTSLEKQLALRREALSEAMSLKKSFDPDVLEEAMRSAYLLKDSIRKASNSREKTSCLQPQLPLLGNLSSELSLEELVSTLKVPEGQEMGDPAIVNLLG